MGFLGIVAPNFDGIQVSNCGCTVSVYENDGGSDEIGLTKAGQTLGYGPLIASHSSIWKRID